MNVISDLLKITAYCLKKLKQKQLVHGLCICLDFIKGSKTFILFFVES